MIQYCTVIVVSDTGMIHPGPSYLSIIAKKEYSQPNHRNNCKFAFSRGQPASSLISYWLRTLSRIVCKWGIYIYLEEYYKLFHICRYSNFRPDSTYLWVQNEVDFISKSTHRDRRLYTTIDRKVDFYTFYNKVVAH
jgi:hypothetical protein